MTLSTPNDQVRHSGSPDSWVLWVDGSGGFLIVDQSQVTIGGPASEREATIGVQADLHRREAALSRHRGEYRIEPLDGRVSIAEQMITETVSLRAGEPFTLGSHVRFWFHQPHPLSASAKLSVEPRTRLRPHVDAVLWLDDTLVLGPSDDCHVQVPHAEGPLVLMRRGARWQVKPTVGKVAWRALTPGRRLDGLGISMTLEPR
ncbi:hypothetical protein [Roseimaritima ulvae]|nr:hypothetical protein [Roseimaritima ulvae]